jgi:hypothetical protein
MTIVLDLRNEGQLARTSVRFRAKISQNAVDERPGGPIRGRNVQDKVSGASGVFHTPRE